MKRVEGSCTCRTRDREVDIKRVRNGERKVDIKRE